MCKSYHQTRSHLALLFKAVVLTEEAFPQECGLCCAEWKDCVKEFIAATYLGVLFL